MRVLFLDPYHGGSHRAFSTGWRDHSAHQIDILELPAHHWKWRMRHAAWTLARRADALEHAAEIDAVIATDMLDLAAWRGLAPTRLGRLPTVLYFHESQLDYPTPFESAPHPPEPRLRLGPSAQRDYHFAFTNLYSAAAADQVWWNSDYHRGRFLAGFAELCARMPDHSPGDALEQIASRSRIAYPGFELLGDPEPDEPATGDRRTRPCHLLWAARWEPDKGAEQLFAALDLLIERGVDFAVSVIGGDSSEPPERFARARAALGDRVLAWGWQESRAEYEAVLRSADVVVSTAHHEFFGIAMVEAVAAGAFPLLPRRLAYPEVFADLGDDLDPGFYDGGVAELAERLAELCRRHQRGDLWQGDRERGRRAVSRYHWLRTTPELDRWLAELAEPRGVDTR